MKPSMDTTSGNDGKKSPWASLALHFRNDGKEFCYDQMTWLEILAAWHSSMLAKLSLGLATPLRGVSLSQAYIESARILVSVVLLSNTTRDDIRPILARNQVIELARQ